MSISRKLPRKVAAVAYEIGQRTLPDYASPFSRKDLTLSQLFACLVLRKFYKTDYRSITAILADNPTHRQNGAKRHFAKSAPNSP